MRQLLLPFTLLTLVVFGLNSCADDVVIIHDTPQASVSFDFWAGARNVEVDGEIFNDGNTFIESVELEIILYDEYGRYINSAFQTFWVDMGPLESFLFSTDLRESQVYDVEVVIHSIR